MGDSPFAESAEANTLQDEWVNVLKGVATMQHEIFAKLDLHQTYLESLAARWQVTPVEHSGSGFTGCPSQVFNKDEGTPTSQRRVMTPQDGQLSMGSGSPTMHRSSSLKMLFDDEASQHEDAESPTRVTDITAYADAMGWRRNMTSVSVFDKDKGDVRLARCMLSPQWSFLSTMIILVNTVIIGIETQWQTQFHLEMSLHREGHGEEPTKFHETFFTVMEFIFLAWMITEVMMGMYVQRKDFFCGKDANWNVFDLTVIVLSVGMQTLQTMPVTFLRVIRVLRLGKVLRTFRVVKYLRGLRTMIISLSGCLMHFSSALLLMSIFMYSVALVIMQGVTADSDHPGDLLWRTADSVQASSASTGNASGSSAPLPSVFAGYSLTDTDVQQVATMYGSLDRAMLTLFLGITGGISWGPAVEPIVRLGTFYGFVVCGFVAFMLFGMLNVLTGIFVDAAMQTAMSDRDNIIQSEIEERGSLINMIRTIFETSDVDGSGTLCRAEFNSLMDNHELRSLLQNIGIDVSEARGLFGLLDDDNSGMVNIDEFITGVLRLKGHAKAVDMISLLFENKKISKKLNKIFRETQRLQVGMNGIWSMTNGPPISGETSPGVPGSRKMSRTSDASETSSPVLLDACPGPGPWSGLGSERLRAPSKQTSKFAENVDVAAPAAGCVMTRVMADIAGIVSAIPKEKAPQNAAPNKAGAGDAAAGSRPTAADLEDEVQIEVPTQPRSWHVGSADMKTTLFRC